MTKTHPQFSSLLLTLVAGVLLFTAPSSAAAQQDGSDPDRAGVLEARAETLGTDEAQFARAAGLFRRAANLRDDADPRKVENLLNAARFSHYAGRSARAIDDAATAARVALRQGDVVRAGHAYLDAAWLARESGKSQQMNSFIQEALLLSNSPLLARADRSGLLMRIGDAA